MGVSRRSFIKAAAAAVVAPTWFVKTRNANAKSAYDFEVFGNYERGHSKVIRITGVPANFALGYRFTVDGVDYTVIEHDDKFGVHHVYLDRPLEKAIKHNETVRLLPGIAPKIAFHPGATTIVTRPLSTKVTVDLKCGLSVLDEELLMVMLG